MDSARINRPGADQLRLPPRTPALINFARADHHRGLVAGETEVNPIMSAVKVDQRG
jgi:hypothetical protein